MASSRRGTKTMGHPQDIVRRHQRVLVPEERHIYAIGNGNGPALEGFITVIGLGGMFIRTDQSMPQGALVHIKIADALLRFECDCIVRNVAEKGIGVEFSSLTPENERRLKDLVSFLKG